MAQAGTGSEHGSLGGAGGAPALRGVPSPVLLALLAACSGADAGGTDALAGPAGGGASTRERPDAPAGSAADAAPAAAGAAIDAAAAPVPPDSPGDAGPAPDADVARPAPVGGLGAAELAGDAPSNGGTITFEQIGARGWYPSRRDPALGPCDAHQQDGCCMARREVDSDRLTPWNEDLIMTLRGPIRLSQLAVYQPAVSDPQRWSLASAWDARDPAGAFGTAFRGEAGGAGAFDGSIGSECLVDVSSDRPFPCGAGSTPYCPEGERFAGWAGSKLLVLLAAMPHAAEAGAGDACSSGADGNWYDAPWIGLSLGELVRAGAFSSCHCYARDPAQWWLGDGCGQLNAFEVVNDNNAYTNLEVFSTNFFGYAGYVGEGPCGAQCDVSALDDGVDLIDKSSSAEASAGALASPAGGPGAAFRRPAMGPRYFLILLHEDTRTVQLALIHPARIPAAASALLPALPGELSADAIDALLALRLPR